MPLVRFLSSMVELAPTSCLRSSGHQYSSAVAAQPEHLTRLCRRGDFVAEALQDQPCACDQFTISRKDSPPQIKIVLQSYADIAPEQRALCYDRHLQSPSAKRRPL